MLEVAEDELQRAEEAAMLLGLLLLLLLRSAAVVRARHLIRAAVGIERLEAFPVWWYSACMYVCMYPPLG